MLLRDELKDLGVTVERGADKVLDKIDPTYAAAFNRETGTIYLRQGVTEYEAFHEAAHARQWAALGKDAYKAQGKYAREKHVFDEIMKNESRFTKDEIKHAQDYIDRLKKRFDAGLID